MLTLLRDRNFGCLFIARTLSVLGNGFGRTSLAFGVLGQKGSTPFDLSIVLTCQAVPQLIFVLLGGVMADRVRRYRLMVAADLLAASAWMVLTYLANLDSIHLIPMAIAAGVAGTASVLFAPAMTGLIPELVESKMLQEANALIRVGQNVSLLAGLSGAGFVISTLGPAPALLLNAVSFLVSAILTSRISIPDRAPRKSGITADLQQGLRELFARQWLWVVVLQFAFVLAAVNATNGVLGPLAATQRLGGPRAWSILAASQAIGTIGGAALAGKIRPRRPILVAVLVTIVLGVPMLLLAARTPLLIVAALMCLAGLATAVFSVLWSTTMQRHISADAISRVSSIDLLGSLVFAPLGLLVAGPLAARFGITHALVGCATLVFISSACALLAPQVRHLTSGDCGARTPAKAHR